MVELLQARGIQALAVTDHNTMTGAFEMAEVSPLPVILAEEIKSTDGDIIGLFLREEIPRDMSPRTPWPLSRIRADLCSCRIPSIACGGPR